MTGTRTSQSGFTLVEVLVATTIVLVVTAAILDVVNQSGGVFQVQPEVSEIQQRLRVGVTQIRRDLMDAGAGSYSGLNDTTNYQTARSLANYFAPVLPYVQSSDANDDGQGRFFSNRMTIISVPTTAAQTSLKSDMTSALAEMKVNQDPGFHAATPDGIGTKAVIYDGSGAFDEFVVTAVDESGATLEFQHLQQGLMSQAYKVPSRISEVTLHAYFLKADTLQLMHDDGFGNVTPVLDNVVALKFEYYGDPSPPAFVAPGTPNLSTTYGPAPPGLSATAPIGSWPLGENCVWTIRRVANTATYVSRLPPIGDGGLALAPLPAESLTDGPWCPDAASANRYDADLLRIRKIRVTLRLQTGNAALRGSLTVGPDAMFVTPGTARSPSRTVPDRAIQFDVSPRNLNLGR